jgi:hypothetical protein
MKNIFVLLMGVLGLCLVFGAIGWFLGRLYTLIELAQQTTNVRVAALEYRLLPVEKEYQQRQKLLTKAKGVISWIRGKF